MPQETQPLCYLTPAVVIIDWATGVPPWKEGSRLPGKEEKGDFIKRMHGIQLKADEEKFQVGRTRWQENKSQKDNVKSLCG